MLDTVLKCKNRLDFYRCIADIVLNMSDYICHTFITEIVKYKSPSTQGNAAACVYISLESLVGVD